MVLLSICLLAAPPDLAAKRAFSAELWRIAEEGGATCEHIGAGGKIQGHECRWPDGTLLARADYTEGYRHFLYYADGEVQTECVLAEGQFDCAEWDVDGRRLSFVEVAWRERVQNHERIRRELEATYPAREAFTTVARAVWNQHADDPERIRARIRLDTLRVRRQVRTAELESMGFLELEIAAILRDEERGDAPIDARPLSEREGHARLGF